MLDVRKARRNKKGAIFVLSVSLVHGGGELIVSQFNQSIAAFIPATGALAVVILLSKLKIYRQSWIIEDSSIMTEKRKKGESGPVDVRTGVAFAPYVVLIAVTILLFSGDSCKSISGTGEHRIFFPSDSDGTWICKCCVTEVFSVLSSDRFGNCAPDHMYHKFLDT